LKDDELLALDNEEPLTQFAASSASKGEEWFVGEDGCVVVSNSSISRIPNNKHVVA